MQPEISLLYVHGSAIGYGRYGVELARHLSRLGVDVYDRIQEEADEIIPVPTPRFVLEEDGTRRHKKTGVVCWVSTPGHARGWWDGQHVAVSTMWEATKLPEAFRESLHNFQTIIVPSDQNLELFSQHHNNVRKVQLGVDLDVWRYVPRETPTTEFRFLIGGSGARKGTDLAVRAFRKVFPDGSWGADDPTPTLILKSPKPEDFYGQRIRRVGGRISAEEEVQLYASAHCYLQPSRGEGFGLQPLQAIAQGCPTILTEAHGHADFAHLGYGLPTTMTKASYFIYGDAGEWWEPDFDTLCEAMRYVYDNYSRAEVFARDAAQIASQQWGWEHTACQLVSAFGGLDALREPYSGPGTWVTPDMKLFRVRVNQPWKTDIGERSLMFEPGVDYWETADIKRIMFEADLLDVDCLNDVDTGLTAAQVEQVGGYQAEHSFCPTCQQKLGSGVTRADEILAELEADAARAEGKKPLVTVCSMFRNSASYLDRYFAQIAALREFVDVRLILAEGDSTDDTAALLARRVPADDPFSRVHTITHGGPLFASVDHPDRWQQIASVIRSLFDKVGDPGDAFLYVESDLIWDPVILAQLIIDLEEVPTVTPLCVANDNRRYYDVWGYRKDGVKFEGEPPYHPGLAGGGLVPVDSCGSCFAARPEVFKRVAAEWDGLWPFHAADGLWVDTNLRVVHP